MTGGSRGTENCKRRKGKKGLIRVARYNKWCGELSGEGMGGE